MKDCTGMGKRTYLTASIREHLETLDDVELAVVLAWLKSGGIYQYGNMLAKLNPQEVIDNAQKITEAQRTESRVKITPIKNLRAK